MEYAINQMYMTEYGICEYKGISEEKHLFKFNDLKWYLPIDTDRFIMESEFNFTTKFLTPKEMDEWMDSITGVQL